MHAYKMQSFSGFFLTYFSPEAEYHNSVYHWESIKLLLEKAGHQSLIAAAMITVFTLKNWCK